MPVSIPTFGGGSWANGDQQYGGFGSDYLGRPDRQQYYIQQMMAANPVEAMRQNMGAAQIAAKNAPPPFSLPPLTAPQIDTSWLSSILGGGSAAQAAPINYSTSINAGPVMSPGDTTAATNAIRNSSQGPLTFEGTPGLHVSNEQSGKLNSMIGRAGQQNANRAATGFERDAAQANASQTLNSQTARANEGVSLANLAAQLQAQQFQQQQRQRGMGGSIIDLLLGGTV